MATFNHVSLVGNLTRDVETRFTGSGATVGSFGIAVNSREKDGAGYKDRADFFEVTVFGKTAEACAEFLSKGSAVLVSGKLRLERWEKDGKKYSAVKVAAFDVQFLSPKKESAAKQAPPEEDIPF